MTKMQDSLNQIAEKVLKITLKTRHGDSLDFHDVAVWTIKEALEAAYKAGQESRS